MNTNKILGFNLLGFSRYSPPKKNKATPTLNRKHLLTLSPLTFYTAILTIFIFIFISHELLTNVPSNHIYSSSTLNKKYFYINMVA